MKKIFFLALALTAVLFVSSCSVTADGAISWSTGGNMTYWSDIVTINKIYRSVFAQYGELTGKEEASGSSVYIPKATSKKQVSDPFENGIEAANNQIKSKWPSITFSTTQPASSADYLTLVVKGEWYNWNESKTFYLVY